MKFYNVFSGFLSGSTLEAFQRNIGDIPFNSLHSYWYLKDLPDEKITEGFKMTPGNIMIDSGAFTAWTKDIDLDVDRYLTWINKWDQYVTTFGQIDVIPVVGATKEAVDDCCRRTWENYLYMTERMNHPEKLLYTFHVGEDIKWLKQALEYRDKNGNPIQYMALGGLVGKPTKIRRAFLDQAFTTIANSSNPNIKVHGFGVSSKKLWKDYPFESCDSFTPGTNANHGYICNEFGSFRPENYKNIFKPRVSTGGLWEDDLPEPKTEAEEAEDTKFRADEKIKILIANIKYWTELGESISKPTFNSNKGLF